MQLYLGNSELFARLEHFVIFYPALSKATVTECCKCMDAWNLKIKCKSQVDIDRETEQQIDLVEDIDGETEQQIDLLEAAHVSVSCSFRLPIPRGGNGGEGEYSTCSTVRASDRASYRPPAHRFLTGL